MVLRKLTTLYRFTMPFVYELGRTVSEYIKEMMRLELGQHPLCPNPQYSLVVKIINDANVGTPRDGRCRSKSPPYFPKILSKSTPLLSPLPRKLTTQPKTISISQIHL